MAIYPGKGLGRTQRPFLAFTLGYAPLVAPVYIQVSGREISGSLTGMEAVPSTAGVRQHRPVVGRIPTHIRSGTATRPLSGRVSGPVAGGRQSPSLAGKEPANLLGSQEVVSSTSGGLHPSEQAGEGYDNEQDGKELGWPLN
jgi:hypothetical protein